MSNLYHFPRTARKRGVDTAHRFHIRRLPNDERGPLDVSVLEPMASSIRSAALGAGKRPEQFALDWFRAAITSSGVQNDCE
jgi:hypothetical protein